MLRAALWEVVAGNVRWYTASIHCILEDGALLSVVLPSVIDLCEEEG